jgi:uncharacterized protein YdeI (YjbR/CyaY-like superfamily)
MKEEILFSNREALRHWLIENHKRPDGIWLAFGKGGNLKTLKAEEALEEALCFRWIDGQFDSIDETKYLKYFAPRRKGSRWSEKNKKLVEKLMNEGLMTDSGLKTIGRAKEDGTWDAPQAISITQEQIDIFAEVVRVNSKAYENFQKMSKSVKKQFVGQYFDAKKEETRIKRLEKLLGLLELNKRPM